MHERTASMELRSALVLCPSWFFQLNAVLRAAPSGSEMQPGSSAAGKAKQKCPCGAGKHLERWRRASWRKYKDRGVRGRLSREMRAPAAPCRDWVGRDISNLLKLIASQTPSSPALPICGEADAQTVACYDEWTKCQGLETLLRSTAAKLQLIFRLSDCVRGFTPELGNVGLQCFQPGKLNALDRSLNNPRWSAVLICSAKVFLCCLKCESQRRRLLYLWDRAAEVTHGQNVAQRHWRPAVHLHLQLHLHADGTRIKKLPHS